MAAGVGRGCVGDVRNIGNIGNVGNAGNVIDATRDTAERRHRQLLEHSPNPVCVLADGHVVYVNSAAIRAMTARNADDLVGRILTDFVHPGCVKPLLARTAALRREGDSSAALKATMLRLDGRAVAAEVVSVLTRWNSKPAYRVIFRDLTVLKPEATHQQPTQLALSLPLSSAAGAHAGDDDDPARPEETAAQRTERRFQTVVNSLDEGLAVLDAHGQPEWINPAARRILGLPVDGGLPTFDDPSAAFPLCDADGNSLVGRRRVLARTLASGAPIRNEIIGYDPPDGGRRWLSTCARVLEPVDGAPSSILITFTDVTDQHNAHLRLNHQAHHDALTGLPNRAYVESRAAQALRTDPPSLAAVMFIDLDNVKTVNDAFGHHAGDMLITTAASRLRSTLRTEDFVARHGGDEFVALIFGRVDRAALDRLTHRLHAALAAPMDVAGTRHGITASIGVAEVHPGDSRDATQILRDADTAMYRAKARRAATRYA